jgi:hypothetical protein
MIFGKAWTVSEQRWFYRGAKVSLAALWSHFGLKVEGCRIVIRTADVFYTENLANRRPRILPRTWTHIVPRQYPVPPGAGRIMIFGKAWTMGEQRWFFRTAGERTTIAEQLKQTPCPHCKRVGMLIRHGVLYGFDDSSPRRTTVRARRVFCSNRRARLGCGRTISIWLADKVTRCDGSA